MDKCMISVELLKILQNHPPALSGFGAGDLWIFERPGEPQLVVTLSQLIVTP